MRFRFTTSLPGLIEGRVIDVDPPFGPDVAEWLRLGILVPVRTIEPERALAPRAVEFAVTRRTRRSRGRRQTRTAHAVVDDCP